jgi:hypothetical protein
MVGEPLYIALRMERFFRIQRAEAAGEQGSIFAPQPPSQGARPAAQATDEPLSEPLQAFIEELGKAAQPNSALPGYALGEQLPGRDPRLAGIHELAAPFGAQALAAPPPRGCYPGDKDSDGDKLCDQYEVLLGTDDTDPDTDRDLITDTLEIEGFVYADRQWYTNPFLGDSNQDGLGDYVEWPEPIGEAPAGACAPEQAVHQGNQWVCPNGGFPRWDRDGDGTPDPWDDDNDNDGVVDSLDLSPWSYTSHGYKLRFFA